MNQRQTLLREVANRILNAPSNGVLRVAVDGVDGAGKTMFADELAPYLATSGRQIIRAGVDSFHNYRAIRYRLGWTSPEGFYRDSYNYELLKEVLLVPLSAGGNAQFRRAAFDHRTDAPLEAALETAAPDAILLFDGIFLHRLELRDFWDFSIFLEVGFDVSMLRNAVRDGCSPDPLAESNRRYVEGQKLYLSECQPRELAKLILNNNEIERPFIVD